MNTLSRFSGTLGGSSPATLYNIINGLGLTSGLKLCLDAGDAASYNPAVQTAKWLDTSGNGYDFYLGTSAVGDAGEPTFFGSAGGLSSSEFFSFDGGDYFRYDTTIETWMSNMHKNNAIFSIIAIVWSPSSFQRTFSTQNTSTTEGLRWNAMAGTQVGQLLVIRSDSGTVLNTSSTAASNVNAWNFVGFSIDEGAATNNILWKVNNNAVETKSGTYSSPDTVNAGPVTLGANGNNSTPAANGSLLACIAVWESVALTSQNLSDLYDGIKGRFGI